MATFVICHGAWDGGWYWKTVAIKLRKLGHEVYTPTLTGLGEREHLGNPSTNLDTHIQDIINVIDFEALKEVVLIGHSYGGVVVTGVANRIPEKLSEIIYIDAFLIENGQSLVDAFGQSPIVEQFVGLANQFGEGWKIPFQSKTTTDPRHVAQPMQTFFQKLNQTNIEAWNILKKSFISCTNRGENPVYQPIKTSADKALELKWPYYELTTGHNPCESMPVELADLLNRIVK